MKKKTSLKRLKKDQILFTAVAPGIAYVCCLMMQIGPVGMLLIVAMTAWATWMFYAWKIDSLEEKTGQTENVQIIHTDIQATVARWHGEVIQDPREMKQ